MLAHNRKCVFPYKFLFSFYPVCVARTLGLHIKGIEEDSLAKKENLFQEDECIVQINDIPLQDKTFSQ